MSDQYWLCCGSKSYEAHHNHCREAAHGFPQHCRFGTSEEHSKWGKGNDGMNIETKYATIDRDELKRLQADADRYRSQFSDGGRWDYHHEWCGANKSFVDAWIDAAILAAQGDSHE